MKKFTIVTAECHKATWEVKAETQEEAFKVIQERYDEGLLYNLTKLDFDHVMRDSWEVISEEEVEAKAL